jgi:hypothetical protein
MFPTKIYEIFYIAIKKEKKSKICMKFISLKL